MGGRGAIALAGAGAAALVWLATARYGPGTTPDSATYLSVAQSLAAGRGLQTYTGGPLTVQPPLFPALVAALIALGITPLGAVRALHALAFGGLAVACHGLFSRITGRAWLCWLAVGLVIASPELLRTFSYAWSEPVFTLLVALTLRELARPGGLARPRSLAMAAVFAALASITRYVGVVLIGVVCLEALLAPGPAVRRLGRAGLAGLIGVGPLLALMARNQALGAGPMGRRLPADAAIQDNAVDLLETLADFLHLSELGVAGVALAALVLAVGSAVGLRLGGGARAAALFFWGYVAAVVLGASLTVVASLYLRFGAPLWPALLALGVALSEAALQRWPRLSRPLLVLAAVGLVLMSLRAVSAIDQARRRGAGGYAVRNWQESELLTLLKYAPVEGELVSNQPALLALYTRQKPVLAPRAHAWRASSVELDDAGRILARLQRTDSLQLAWFNDFSPSYGFLLPEALMTEGISAKPERLCSDGTLYRMRLHTPPPTLEPSPPPG